MCACLGAAAARRSQSEVSGGSGCSFRRPPAGSGSMSMSTPGVPRFRSAAGPLAYRGLRVLWWCEHVSWVIHRVSEVWPGTASTRPRKRYLPVCLGRRKRSIRDVSWTVRHDSRSLVVLIAPVHWRHLATACRCHVYSVMNIRLVGTCTAPIQARGKGHEGAGECQVGLASHVCVVMMWAVVLGVL